VQIDNYHQVVSKYLTGKARMGHVETDANGMRVVYGGYSYEIASDGRLCRIQYDWVGRASYREFASLDIETMREEDCVALIWKPV